MLPAWCANSDEFIRTHRLLLESDLVSKKLNNWIDIIFGYKLTSEAAIESKNVCLPLIDNHQSMDSYGITQLFTIPHPYKIGDTGIYHSKTMPKITKPLQQQFKHEDQTAKMSEIISRRKSVVRTNQSELFNEATQVKSSK